MRGALINLAEGLLPFPILPGGSDLQQSLQEAVYWLWRVRTVNLRVDVEVTGTDEDGDTIKVVNIHQDFIITVPLGLGIIGSRTEADQLIKRRGYSFDDIVDDHATRMTFGFASFLTPLVSPFWTVGVGFSIQQSGLLFIQAGNPLLPPCGTLDIQGDDAVLGGTYSHTLELNGVPEASGAVTVTPIRFQEWALNGVPLYDSSSGALLP